jgi:hypothetical protein
VDPDLGDVRCVVYVSETEGICETSRRQCSLHVQSSIVHKQDPLQETYSVIVVILTNVLTLFLTLMSQESVH